MQTVVVELLLLVNLTHIYWAPGDCQELGKELGKRCDSPMRGASV